MAPQALFAMNAPFVIDQAAAVTKLQRFTECKTDVGRVAALFELILQREADPDEIRAVTSFLSRWRSEAPSIKRIARYGLPSCRSIS